MLGLGSSLATKRTLYFTNTYSLSFNGTTEYGNLAGTIPAININVGTISLWVKLDTGNTNMQLIKASVDSNNNIQIYQKHSDNKLYFVYKAGGVTKQVATAFNYEGNDTWYHLIMTWDTTADELKAYINGDQVESTVDSLGTFSGTIDEIYIARNSTAANAFLAGHLDEVAIFDSVQRTETLYSSGGALNLMGNANLIGWWRMEEGVSTKVADSSSNTNVMTLSNTPTWSTDKP